MASNPIFTAADDAILTERKHLKPATGRRRYASSSVMNSEIISSSGFSFGGSETNFFIIPNFLHSEETFEYLGFGPQKAAELWSRWESIQESASEEDKDTIFEVEFLDLALGSIPSYVVEDSEDDWVIHMQDWGVGPQLINAIMSQEFSDVRRTESASYWVTDTMEIRYATLERVKEDSEARAEGITPPSAGIATSTSRPSNVPGKQILFKAVTTNHLLRDEGGKIRMPGLVSNPPSDFRGVGGALFYFTPDFEVAKRYKGYIKKRADSAPAVIVCLTLPNAFIEGLPPYILEFGDLWKQVVHRSRSSYLLTGDLGHIHRLPLVIAPVSYSHNRAIARLESWQQISTRHVMHIGENMAKQYVFQGSKTMVELERLGEIEVV